MRIIGLGNTATDFASDDYIAIDGTTNGSRKLKNDSLLNLTAQNTLAGKMAPAFDGTRTIGNEYKVGEVVIYNGKRYIFKNPHYGAWSFSDVQEIQLDIDNLSTFFYRVYSGGFILDSLNNALDNKIYFIQRESGVTTTNFPSDAPTKANYIFVSLRVYSSSSQYQREQRLLQLDNNQSWSRQYNSINGVWSSWAKPSIDYMPLDENQIFHTSSTNPANLNDLNTTQIVRVWRDSSVTTTNFPTDYPVGNDVRGTLSVYKVYSNKNSNQYQIYQILTLDGSLYSWTRMYNSINGVWSSWAKTAVDYMPLDENQIFHTAATNPASLNDYTTSKIVRVWRDSSVTTTNFPSDYPVGNDVRGTLSIYKVYSTKAYNQYQIYQVLTLDSSNEFWTRYYNSLNSTWSSWVKAKPAKNTIVIGAGQAYTTLKAGMAEAYSRGDAEVIIMPGVYDCVTEWSTEMHAVEEDTPVFGNPVGNNMHVIAMPGAKVTAILERANFSDLTDAKWKRLRNYFEPFGARLGSFVVENLEIESKNTRYCFHDDYGSEPCVRKFLNCRMIRHTDYDEAIHNPLVACIGGGLGLKENVVIDGGWYRTEPNYGNLDIMGGDVDYAQVPISYHQNAGNSCEASITIKNVYLDDKGFFRFGYYGTSVKKCKVLVSGCRMKYPPLLCRETTGSIVKNFELVDWCNEVVENGHWATAESGPLNSTWVPDT